MSEHVCTDHPKDTPEGMIMWPRTTPYIAGDRVRGTVILVTQYQIYEMVPSYAEAFAKEILVHATDVRAPRTASEKL